MSAYSDPADLVAQTRTRAQADDIKTWAVSELNTKGKKKKGTLGVGNGTIFFASESDKTPVRKWKTIHVQHTGVVVDKKQIQVRVNLGGASAEELHFAVSNKAAADAIVAKIQASSFLAGGGAVGRTSTLTPPPQNVEAISPSRKNGASVRFTDKSPEIIPPREPSDNEDDAEADAELPAEDYIECVALYDFEGTESDELTVQEGQNLWIIEKEGEDWWKCRNEEGYEGVVPATYLKIIDSTTTYEQEDIATQEDAVEEDAAKEEVARLEAERRERERELELELERQRLAEEAEKRAEAERMEMERRKKADAERLERQRKRAEAEQRAKVAAAAEAEAEKKRQEEAAAAAEAERKRQEAAREAQQKSERERGDSSRPMSFQSKPSRESTSSMRKSTDIDKSPAPPPGSTRTWRDRTGQFRVEAAFLGYCNGKLRLHKLNGVTIEVPSEKMSQEDMRHVERLMMKPSGSGPQSTSRQSADDGPLGLKRREEAAKRMAQSKRGPTVDWFEFFLSAGCDVDDCTRYASSFERDKIDEAILPDITESTMRSLGLREGDIIRVKKVIQQKYVKSQSPVPDQVARDERLARKLQEEENAKKSVAGPAPNLFAGPGGVLKNNTQRRGRPQPGKSVPPPTVDMDAIGSASEQIRRTESPLVLTTSPVAISERPSSALAAPKSGFDDDAWTNRPGTKSSTPVPTPPSAAPAAQPAAVPTPSPAPPISATGSQTQENKGGLAKTDAELFDQLARLSQLKMNRTVPSPAPAPTSATAAVAPTPVGYNNGLGMGSSPAPMAQHLQNQQTGVLAPPQNTGPRGPYAPVPANQGLLQPLLPTTTGFNSFVPARNASSSPYQIPQQVFQSQPTGFSAQSQLLVPQATGFPAQSQSLIPQATGFSAQSQSLVPQPTGFSAQSQSIFPQTTSLAPQPTGFSAGPQPLLSQPTGVLGGPFGNFASTQTPPFSNAGILPLQPNPTGLSPFGQPMLTGTVSTPPLAQSNPSSSNQTTSPANIFAQMKSGTFATENDHTAPQQSAKYDALRVNPQPTGFIPQTPSWGFQGGYTGFR